MRKRIVDPLPLSIAAGFFGRGEACGMRLEGSAAKRLLKASNTRIIFREESDRTARVIKFMDGEGFRSELISKKSRRYNSIRETYPLDLISTEDFLEELLSPEGIVGWLRRQLDEVAERAPKP